MAATPRLNLVKPEGTDLCNPIAAMHEQYDTIDEVAGTTLISEEEPTASFIGQEWWEPISKTFFIWNGLIWAEVDLVPSGPPPGPSGRKAFTVASNVSDFGTLSSGESAAFIPTTFAATSGAKYEFNYCGAITCDTAVTGMQALLTMRIASGGSVTSAGTLVAKVSAGRNSAGAVTPFLSPTCSFRGMWTATGTGNFTVGVFVRKESGYGSSTIAFKASVYHALSVEEVLQP